MGRSLLDGGRRYLAAALGAILALPAVAMLDAPRETVSVMERRMLAPLPSPPRTPAQWIALPRTLDAWFADHFAGRPVLVRADLLLQARTGLKPPGGTEAVQGKGDWLLLTQGLLGASGGQTDPAAADRYAAFVCDLSKAVRARGARFLFAPAPGPAEIYPEALPPWLPRGAPTQPERVLAAARACGAPILDLRPAMRAAKGQGGLYQHHDTHWTNIGALVAYDAVAQALGEPWAISPSDMHWRPEKARESDLVRLSGAVDLPPETLPEPPEGPDSRPTAGGLGDLGHGPYPPAFLIPGARPGPPLLIVGDSYTSDFMAQYFRRSGPALAWIHQNDCRFDRRVFDRVRPAMVVLMPASRLEACR